MRTMYRHADTREPGVAEQILSLIERDKPDVVIVETDNVNSLTDLLARGELWRNLGDWNTIFAGRQHEAGGSCLHISSPWELREAKDPTTKLQPFQIGRVEVGGPRPGTVRATWPPEASGIDIDSEPNL